MVDINIVIVNYKMRDDIERCLKTLIKCFNNDLSIIVNIVDNSQNQDNIKEIFKNLPKNINYLDAGGNKGFGFSQNLGMKRTKAKYYFVLNPDVIFEDENTLVALYDYMEKNLDVGMCGPKLLNFDGSLQYSCFRFPKFFDKPAKQLELDKKFKIFKKRVDYFMMKDFDHNKEICVDWIMGSAMFVRDKAIEDVGFFDERFFMYFEDCDWCRRMWDFGWKVKYVPSIVIKHKHRRDSAKIPGLISSIIKNPITRIHIKSWLKYFFKWGFKQYNPILEEFKK